MLERVPVNCIPYIPSASDLDDDLRSTELNVLAPHELLIDSSKDRLDPFQANF